MHLFHSDNAAEILQMMSPVVQLDKCNQTYLETNDYMVGPKADGDRTMLLFQPDGSSFYLINHSCPPKRIEGTYTGQKIKGFVLDTEVVISSTGSQLILAFDVIDIGRCAYRYKRKLHSFSDRHNILKTLIQSISIPNLYLKAIAPSHQAESMWEVWQHLPYPIDGLIFTPIKGRQRNARTIKWKPKTHLTLDIALGGMIGKEEGGSSYIAHLYGENGSGDRLAYCDIISASGHKAFFYPFACLKNQGEEMNDEIRNTRVHQSFYTFEAAAEEDDEGNDIIQTHLDDIQNIQTEHFAETKNWTKPSIFCSCEDCPCRDDNIFHCRDCGTLGVGNDTFTCLSTCSFTTMIKPNNFLVWVPTKYDGWAKHGIVEVELISNISEPFLEFRFKRIRHDKKRANSFSVASTIIQAYLQPTVLCDINFKVGSDTLLGREQECYRLPKTVHRSNFTELRKMHYNIKGWLYKTFGGQVVIDACAGSLHDLHNWVKGKFTSVLAIELDKYQYQKGLSTIQHHNKNADPLPTVCLVQEDLSSPFDKSNINILRNPVDAIFCNFALHYFWSSQEETTTFLDNLLPHLSEGGRFVVTFLQGEMLQQKRKKILSDGNLVEFEAKMLNGGTCSVYIASIGVPHIESIINRSELQKRFKAAGLDLVLWLPFEVLWNICNGNLSKEEKEMSSMYAAAVFQKSRKQTFVAHEESDMMSGIILSHNLPSILEREIIGYFSIPDIVKCRVLSIVWRHEVDELEIEKSVRDNYFHLSNPPWCTKLHSGCTAHRKVFCDHHVFMYKSESTTFDLTLKSVALYQRMGGQVMEEDHDDDDYKKYSQEDHDDDDYKKYSHNYDNRYTDFSDG